jgi:hypothetical protein
MTHADQLALIGATRNRDVKSLDLLAPGGKAHFEFEAITLLKSIGTIERDASSKFGGQTLFDIGCFERRAVHGDGGHG